MRMYVRRKGGYGAFPLMTEVTSIHAPKIMKYVWKKAVSRTGSGPMRRAVLPAGGSKQAGCRRGVGRDKEAYSPPGSAAAGMNGGE